jgi:hypothetical protein
MMYPPALLWAKMFHGSHCLDLVMIRQQSINYGTFVVSPDTVWYAWILLLFSASTDTGSKSFDCALVSTLAKLDDPENDNGINYINYVEYYADCHAAASGTA